MELDSISFFKAETACETFEFLRDYPKAEAYYNSSIMLQPDRASPYTELSLMLIRWKGDTKKAREILENAVRNTTSYLSDSLLTEINVLINMYDGKYEAALKGLSHFRSDVFQTQFYFRPKYLYYANIYGLMHKPVLEHSYYDSTRLLLEKK